MKIAVLRESRDGEARVALVSALVDKLVALGYVVAVEPEAGLHAEHEDEAFVVGGAAVRHDAVDGADLELSVQPPEEARDRISALIASFVASVPRISRVPSMDVLSSQALVAADRCAIVAAGTLRRFLPLNLAAAGTLPPAEVVVPGAGVAGLGDATKDSLSKLLAAVKAL